MDPRDRTEIAWLFAVIIGVLLLGSASVYYANSVNPGLAYDNGAAPSPTADGSGVNAANRAPPAREEPAQLIR